MLSNTTSQVFFHYVYVLESLKDGKREGTSRTRGGKEDEGIRTCFIVGFLRSCSKGSSSVMANEREYKQTDKCVSMYR